MGLNLVDIIRGVDFQTRCLMLALEAGEPTRLSRCFAVEAVANHSEGRKGRARSQALFEQAEVLAKESGERDVWSWLLLSRGITAMQTGRFQECFEAATEAARVRLRPIVMTSFAFILGVLPLVIAEGAGAEMRRTLGTAVFAGMIGVTLFGIFLTPVFYVLLRALSGNRPLKQHGEEEEKATQWQGAPAE